MKAADLATDSVDDAVAVTRPGVGDVTTTLHSPASSVTHSSGPAGSGAAPFEDASAIVTVSPAAGTNEPVPVSSSNRAVKVCGLPARAVPVDATEILASIQVVMAGSESARSPSLRSVRDLPSTASVEWADTRVEPVTLELTSTWQPPLPSATVQGFGEVIAPGPESTVNQMLVPFGAGCAPEALHTFTWPVIVRDPPARTAS